MIPVALTFLTALFGAVGKVFEWLYAKRLADAGKVQAGLEALEREVAAARVAVAAREQQRARDSGGGGGFGPDGLPDDPFRRD